MKNTKQLQKIYNDAAKLNKDLHYFTFENFKEHAKDFLKDVRNRETICHMDVSRSGMMRRFNFHKFNMLLNILIHKKFSWDPVKMGGCGMDMHWHLKFTACQLLLTDNESKNGSYNNDCSSGILV